MSCTILQPDKEAIAACATRLRNGRLVSLPTETVYGLAADATNDRAIASIYEAKGRPSFNPLIVHLAYADDAARYAKVTPLAKILAGAFWPGPLTLVLNRTDDCPLSLLVSAGLDTVALRVPSHPVTHALLLESGLPLAAPSANISGHVSPTAAVHVAAEFAEVDLPVLDGGPCVVGLESTVIDARGDIPILLRPGGITDEQITAICGIPPLAPRAQEGIFHSPGMLSSHYAPERPVRLEVSLPHPGEAFLAFGPHYTEYTLNLSLSGDLTEAAANLFAYLRSLDKAPYTGIAVSPVPRTGLGIAINDRLQRASVPR